MSLFPLLYIQNEFLDHIQFKESLFYIDNHPGEPRSIFDIRDKEDYLICQEEAFKIGKYVGFYKIILKSSFPEYDFFIASMATNVKLMSERLKKAIEKEGLIGLDFRRVNFSQSLGFVE